MFCTMTSFQPKKSNRYTMKESVTCLLREYDMGQGRSPAFFVTFSTSAISFLDLFFLSFDEPQFAKLCVWIWTLLDFLAQRSVPKRVPNSCFSSSMARLPARLVSITFFCFVGETMAMLVVRLSCELLRCDHCDLGSTSYLGQTITSSPTWAKRSRQVR